MASQNGELHGWKEIAQHLGRSVRAAQRWERELGLPVHRMRTTGSHAVWARRHEIDAWRTDMERRHAAALEPSPSDEDNDDGQDTGRSAEHAPAAPPEAGPARPPAQSAPARPRPRLRPLLLACGALGVVAGLLTVATWAGGLVTSSGAPSLASPADAPVWDRDGLDSGPWPVAGHDRRGSRQSHLAGPAAPVSPRLLLDLGSPLTPHLDGFVVTAAGLLLGTCDGEVLQVGFDGGVGQRLVLDRSVSRQAVSYFAATHSSIAAATMDCPQDPGANARTQFHVLGHGLSSIEAAVRTAAMALPPAVAIDGSFYQKDENGAVRAFDAAGDLRWTVDLPGYSGGPIVIGGDGTLYVPTDAHVFGHAALWAISPDGRILWSAGEGVLTAAAVGVTGEVHAVDAGDGLAGRRVGPALAVTFAPDGALRWRRELSGRFPRAGLAVSRAGALVVKTSDAVTRIDASTGAIQWRVELTPREEASELVLDRDDHAYFTASDHVHSLAPDGRLRWRLPLPGASRLVVGGEGLLVVSAGDRQVYTIRDERP